MTEPTAVMAQEKKFSDLLVGDRVKALAKLIQIKADERHEVPHWYLLSLFDGTKTIKIFVSDITSLHVGEILKVEFSVKEGRPYQGKPQLAFDILSLSKSKEPPPLLVASPVVSKTELKDFEDGQRVSLYTQYITLKPKDGEREKMQKILVQDLEQRPISVWISKEDLPVFYPLSTKDRFVLHATVKKVKENPNARFLSFEKILRGKDALADPAARKYFIQAVEASVKDLLSLLKDFQEQFAYDVDRDMLRSMLENYWRNTHAEEKA